MVEFPTSKGSWP